MGFPRRRNSILRAFFSCVIHKGHFVSEFPLDWLENSLAGSNHIAPHHAAAILDWFPVQIIRKSFKQKRFTELGYRFFVSFCQETQIIIYDLYSLTATTLFFRANVSWMSPFRAERFKLRRGYPWFSAAQVYRNVPPWNTHVARVRKPWKFMLPQALNIYQKLAKNISISAVFGVADLSRCLVAHLAPLL